MVLANGGVKSAYEWFNGFMGLVLGILIGIKYFVPAESVTIWSYSLISIVVSLVVGIPASLIWRKVKGDTSVPAPNTTVFKN